MMPRYVVILTLLVCAPAFAQPRPRSGKKSTAKAEPATRWPVESLTVQGNHDYSKDQILAVTGLKVGQLAGKNEFDGARDRLVATGAFETVSYRFEPSKDSSGYAASFQVVEAGPLFPVQFEGLKTPAVEIHAWLKSQDPLYGPKI